MQLNNEFGFCLLVDPNHIPTLTTDNRQIGNIPHISLFQGIFSQTSLKRIIQAIESSAIRTQIPKTITMQSDIYLDESSKNVFWDVSKECSKKIEVVSNQLISIANPLRSSKKLKQIQGLDIAQLSKKQQQYILEYGIYWVRELLNPHITLAYNVSSYTPNKGSSWPKTIKVNGLAIVTLGYHGNAVKIIPPNIDSALR